MPDDFEADRFMGGTSNSLRQRNVTPHLACKKYSAIHGRTTRHEGHQISQ